MLADTGQQVPEWPPLLVLVQTKSVDDPVVDCCIVLSESAESEASAVPGRSGSE